MADQGSLINSLFFLMASFASLNCLGRPDYNIAFALLFLYLWNMKRVARTAESFVFMIVFLLIADLVWLIVVGVTWGQSGSPAWEELSTLHSWVIIFSIVNMLVKGVLALKLKQFAAANADDRLASTL
eukprot:CAMPEP_0115006188 /NCGR_PEP_ID=MMETSP0216-20121206/20340_1 /TAXON_ID=223996 /ORGANISM="Protocruzia adherens, Strain Boccale" /LENGTH=127 /DNA_ID=CAMNT_0002372701 /DNA_START=56 /DNA_END=439 /DNA_ORIENTATION=-